MKKEKNILPKIKRTVNCIGHILLGNRLLNHIVVGEIGVGIEVTGRQEIRR